MKNMQIRLSVVLMWSVVIVVCGRFSIAAAQTTESPSLPGATIEPPHDQSDPQAIFRAPLLREGSAIIDAKAHIERDPAKGWWRLIIDHDDSNASSHELVLLPCTRLSEMQRLVEASPNRVVQFQVSGRVFVYRKRNYVLPTYAPVLAEQERSIEFVELEIPVIAPSTSADDSTVAVPMPPAAEATPDSAANSAAEQSTNSDRTEDIIKQLDRAAGPLAQSPAPRSADREPAAVAANTTTDSASAPPRVSPLAASSTDRNAFLAEESSIVNRRGKITRDSAGGWMFVFDADATGLADPPVRILPCLLLERIEDYARRQGNNSPALLSGVAYLHEGRNYLMPTVFRIPQERRNLSP